MSPFSEDAPSPAGDGSLTTRRRVTASLRLTAVAAAGLLALTACGSGGSGESTAEADNAAPATRTVSTEMGDVEIPSEPQRIVSLNPTLTGDLLSLDASVASTAVGMSGGVRYDEDGFPVHWNGAAQEAGVEIFSTTADISLEALASAEPDLIVAGGVGRPMATARDMYDQLSAVAPTIFIDSSDSTWQEQLTTLGEMLGAEDKAAELLDGYETRVAEVTEGADLPEQPTNVASSGENGIQTLTNESPGMRLLTDFGFEPAEEVATPEEGNKEWAPVSEEEITDVFTGETLLVYESQTNTPVSELAEDALWSKLPAFENDSAFPIPTEVRRPDYLAAMYAADWFEQEFGAQS
ncbi:ABC transporter substrate-binding protein [Marinactinospora thermotolerans]|nr:ABC transporter substrate-binding protein [Marinactinospora thermotolerans]